MPTTAAYADLIQRVRLSSTLSQASPPTSSRQVSTVINQPLATVLAHLRSVTRGKVGQTAESDPTLETTHVLWGCQVCVRYTGYEMPGGSQVTALIESSGHRLRDPRAIVAVHFVSRRIATDLSRMRDDLE